MELNIHQFNLEIVQSYKYLGVELNPQLTLNEHIQTKINLVSAKINTLSYLKKYINHTTLLMIYKATILPIMEYSNILSSLIPKNLARKKQSLQNRALKIIFSHELQSSKEDLHLKAKLTSISQRADKQLLCSMFKRSHQPEKYAQIDRGGITRQSDKVKFDLPRPRIERFKAFPHYRGANLWDSLSCAHQHALSLLSFKNQLGKQPNFEQYPV